MIARLLHANTRYLALVILTIVVVGYTSLNGMARKEDPAITPFFASVQTPFLGASPARVEAMITKPLVDALRAYGCHLIDDCLCCLWGRFHL